MLGPGWLPLNDYSSKYNISISTLRRRIRASSIENQFRDGKYWLKDKPTNRAYVTDRDDLASVTSAPVTPVAVTVPTAPVTSQTVPANILNAQSPHVSAAVAVSDDARALEMANHLVSELKSAYVLILQEKEEQILLLKEETADLKTLVRILESENQRLKNGAGDINSPHGEWLSDSLEP